MNGGPLSFPLSSGRWFYIMVHGEKWSTDKNRVFALLCLRSVPSEVSDENGSVCHQRQKGNNFPPSPCFPSDLMLTALRVFLTQSVHVSLRLKIHPWTPWTYRMRTKFLRMPPEQSCSQLPTQRHENICPLALLHACAPQHCSYSQE